MRERWLLSLLVVLVPLVLLTATPRSSSAAYNPAYPWDVNGDGVVDIADVALIGSHMGESGPRGWIPEDVNRDGVVDVADVAMVGTHWGEVIPTGSPTPTSIASPARTRTSTPTPTPTPIATATQFVPPTWTPTATPLPLPVRGSLAFGAARTSSGAQPAPGDVITFDINVNLDAGAVSRGIEFRIVYDASRLAFRTVTIPPTAFFSDWASHHGASTFAFPWSVESPGRTNVGGISVIGGPAGVGVTGGGTVATVSFTALAGGHALLTADTAHISLLASPTSTEKFGLTVTDGGVTISGAEPSPTATRTATSTSTASPTASATGTLSSATATATPPTVSGTSTPTPTATATPTTVSGTSTPTPTATATPTTVSRTSTPTPTATSTPTVASVTRTPTLTRTPSVTPTVPPNNTSLTFSNLRTASDGSTLVDVVINTDLTTRGVQFGLSFDQPRVIGVTSVDQASFYSDWAAANGAIAQILPNWMPDSATGTVSVGGISLLGGPVDPSLPAFSIAGPTGRGTVATISMTGLAPGTTTLSFVSPRVTYSDRGVIPPYLTIVPATVNTAVLTVPGAATATPTPTVTPSVTPSPGSTPATLGPTPTWTPTVTMTPLPSVAKLHFATPTTPANVGDLIPIDMVIEMDSGKKLGAIQFALTWDPPDILELQDRNVTAGSFLTGFASTHSVGGTGSVLKVGSFAPTSAGHSGVAGFSLSGTTLGDGPTGSGTVVQVKFRALKNGSARVSLDQSRAEGGVYKTYVAVVDPGDALHDIKQALTVTPGNLTVGAQSNTATPTQTPTRTPTVTTTATLNPTQAALATQTVAAQTAIAAPTGTPKATDVPKTPEPTPTLAPGTRTVSLSPSTLSIAPNATATIAVALQSDLVTRSMQFGLKYDPSKVKIVSIDEGTYYGDWASRNGAYTSILPPWKDDGKGRVAPGSVSINGGPVTGCSPFGCGFSGGGPTGSGTVAVITLQGVANGTSSLELTDLKATAWVTANQYSQDYTLQPVAPTLQVSVGGATTPTPTPTVVGGSTPTPTLAALPGGGQIGLPVGTSGQSLGVVGGQSGVTSPLVVQDAQSNAGVDPVGGAVAVGQPQSGGAVAQPGAAQGASAARSQSGVPGAQAGAQTQARPGALPGQTIGGAVPLLDASGHPVLDASGTPVTIVPGTPRPAGAPAPAIAGVTASREQLTLTPVQIDLRNAIDDQGRVTSEVLFADPTHGFSLRIPAGTVALTGDRRAVRTITANVVTDPPVLSEEQALLGRPLEFEPNGATFNPPIRLTLSYDPRLLPEGLAEGDLDLAFFDEKRGQWVSLDGSVEPGNATVSTSISHFTSFAVVTRAPSGVNWLLVAGILGLEGGLGLGVYYYIQRRRMMLAAVDVGQYVPVTPVVTIAGMLPPATGEREVEAAHAERSPSTS